MRLSERMKTWLELAKQTWTGFSADNGFLVAGALSFFAFLSIFPAMLAGVGILGLVLGSPKEAEQVILSATSQYAVGSQAKQLVADVVNGGSTATWIGILVSLWSGSTAMVMLEQAINVAWDVQQRQGVVQQRARALLMFVLVGILLLLSVGLTALVGYVQTTPLNILPAWSWFYTLLSYLIPLFVIVAAFTLVYRILPNADVRWKTALIAGVTAGILWEIALQAFTFYVVQFASYNRVYGSLGAVILLLVWVDYSSIILLLGAELGATLQGRRQQRQEREERDRRRGHRQG